MYDSSLLICPVLISDSLALQDVEALLKKGTSEIMRDAARLNEQLLQLRLERGKLQREEVLLREKVRSGASSVMLANCGL